MPEQINVIPEVKMYRGPDQVKGLAFMVTPYPDRNGKRFFSHPQNHIYIVDNLNVLEAIFGPKLEEMLPQLRLRGTGTGGFGQAIDAWEVRKHSLETTLYGRKGKIEGIPNEVIGIWMAFPGWEKMLYSALGKLGDLPKDTILTVGRTTQYYLKDWLNEYKGQKTVKQEKLSDDERHCLELLAQYHTATGYKKQQLKRQLQKDCEMLGTVAGYPDVSKMSPEEIEQYPWKRHHWRTAARRAGIRGVFDYGEHKLNFKQFIERIT